MAKAPKDGIRIGGVDYPSGATLPERYSRVQAVSTRQRDPAIATPDSPPNMGRMVLPQVITFSGLTTSLARAYRYSDAALRASVENAHMMLADPQIEGPLLARQSMVALLNWSVESENDEEPQLKEAAQRLTKILAKTPRFTEYRRALMEAIWYGRYAIQNAFCFHTDRTGKRSRIVKKWSPISGDKLMFRYDDGSGDFDPDQVGVRVTPALGRKDIIGGDRQLEATGEGMAYFLQPWERRHLCIHKHMIRDGEYEDPLSGGQIHGVGLRHFLYWVWYQKQETMAQIAEIVDRTGNGFTIYYYPEGNPSAKEEVQKVAREQAHTNVILMPTDPNNPNAYEVQQIPPNTTGLQVLHDFVETFLGDMIIRFILGQTLSSKPDSTGMGSGIADLQKDTLFQIARYDAVNLEETITRELLLPLRDFNLSKYRNVDFFFKISTKVSAPDQELAAIQKAYDMGAEIKTSDIFDKLDLSMPKPGDKTLFNPQIIGAIKQLNTPQPPPGAPPGPPGGPAGPEAGGPDQGGPPPDEGGGAPPVDQGPDAGTPEQLDKVPQDDEKQRLFGPILYSRKQEYRDRLRAAVDATDANPSEQQKLAGNYRKGKFWWHSIEIAIENPKGTKRRKEWPAIAAHYGYMRRTLASDGDALDAFIGPELESELVIIIAQMNQTGRFDEFKVVIGFSDTEKAIQCYCDSYSFRPEFWYASITTDQFTQAILNDDGNSTTVASRRILDLEGHASTVSERKILALPLVWWKGNSRLREVGQLCDILERHGASPDTTTHNRAGKFQRRLLSGELPLGDENGAKSQHYSKSKVSGEDDLAVVRGNWNPSKDNHNAAESGLELEGGCNNSAKDASQGLPTVDAQWNQQATVPLGERGKYGSGNSAIQNPVGMDDGRGSLNSSGKASALQSLTSPIFDGDRIKPEIGERLRQIARDFIRGTAIPRDAIQDVVLTGSLASGGWTGQSDLDLHITVDSEAISGDPDMVRDYLYEVGANWNARHGITILGHEVEIFVEPVHVFPEQYAKKKGKPDARQRSLFGDDDDSPSDPEFEKLHPRDEKGQFKEGESGASSSPKQARSSAPEPDDDPFESTPFALFDDDRQDAEQAGWKFETGGRYRDEEYATSPDGNVYRRNADVGKGEDPWDLIQRGERKPKAEQPAERPNDTEQEPEQPAEQKTPETGGKPEDSEKPAEQTAEHSVKEIPYSRELNIVNLDQLPRGTGAPYLEVLAEEGKPLVAMQWRTTKPSTLPGSHALVSFKKQRKEPKRGIPPRTSGSLPPPMDDDTDSLPTEFNHAKHGGHSDWVKIAAAHPDEHFKAISAEIMRQHSDDPSFAKQVQWLVDNDQFVPAALKKRPEVQFARHAMEQHARDLTQGKLQSDDRKAWEQTARLAAEAIRSPKTNDEPDSQKMADRIRSGQMKGMTPDEYRAGAEELLRTGEAPNYLAPGATSDDPHYFEKMSQDEYVKYRSESLGHQGVAGPSAFRIGELQDEHFKLVANALKNGEMVPRKAVEHNPHLMRLWEQSSAKREQVNKDQLAEQAREKSEDNARQFVVKALAAGKTVPQNVLDKYPDLQKSEEKPAQKLESGVSSSGSAVGSKTWFGGDELTITSEPYELHGGMYQDAERADWKKFTIPTREHQAADVAKKQAEWREQQAGFKRLHENTASTRAPTAADLRNSLKSELAKLDGELESTTKELGRQKSRTSSSSKKAAIESQWRAAKDDIEKRRQSVIEDHRKRIDSHPDTIAERERAGERAKQMREESQQTEQTAVDSMDADMIQRINGAGGFDKVAADTEARIRDLEGRLKRTGEANKWKTESHLKTARKELDEIQRLRSISGKSQETPKAPSEKAVSNLVKQVTGPMTITQKRAMSGGEIGPNGEWYPGGAFIATQDLPKRERDKINKTATGKVQVDGYQYEVPKPGQMALLDKLGGTVLNPRNGEINYDYLEYSKASEDEVRQYEELAKKWLAGERWVSVNDYPMLAGIKDVARLVVAGEPVPGAVMDKLPETWRSHFQKYRGGGSAKEQPRKHWYGLHNRPIGHATVPKGFSETKQHEAFRHGAVAYDRPLSEQEQYDFELTPIRHDSEIPEVAKAVAQTMGDYVSDYLDPENAEILDDKLRHPEVRKILGHVDLDKLKAELKKQNQSPE